ARVRRRAHPRGRDVRDLLDGDPAAGRRLGAADVPPPGPGAGQHPHRDRHRVPAHGAVRHRLGLRAPARPGRRHRCPGPRRRRARLPRRLASGLASLLSALSAIASVPSRLPAPADGIAALARGGGVLGYLAAAPLEALVPPVAVIILHSVLIAFGVLVLTATPVESIPSRLRGVYEVMVGRSEEEDEERVAFGLRPRRADPAVHEQATEAQPARRPRRRTRK